MKLSIISANSNEVTLSNGVKVLFSYNTPVACWIDGQFYKTDKSWSKTTSKHINAWAHLAVLKPQSYFDTLSGSN